jgi:hypothetical protein
MIARILCLAETNSKVANHSFMESLRVADEVRELTPRQ